MTRTQPELSLDSSIGISTTEPSASPDNSNLLTQAQIFLRSHLVETITVSVAASVVLLGATGWNIWNIYRDYKTVITNQFKLQDLSGQIVHFDEVLTMSARMAASTGDSKWEKRYRQFEPELDQAIKQTTQLAPEAVRGQSAQTDAANLKLIEMENRAFTLVRQKKQQEAFKLLLGQEYDTQKQIYAQGIQSVIANIKKTMATQVQSYSQRLLWSFVFVSISFPILVVAWSVVLFQIKIYIRDRQLAQQSLLESQESLLKLNEELEARTVQLLKQEQNAKQENEVLQVDVEHILDVVSAAETGDLTIQAEVSDRATGLVADTLNRLIEELARIMAAVLSTAQQVTQGSTELEQLAAITAQQAQQQAQSVSAVQASIVNFNDLSQQTAQQAIVSDQAVQQAQIAVSQGQQEMGKMTEEIKALHSNTEQIVKRAQLLTNFVTSAAQFAKDQKRVATLTRVLALNASMIAARASGQQDPEQFASIAREFETIATQVNDLAVQTNQGLLLLQQQTAQIQTVVSGINQDVRDISDSVGQFVGGVEQSQHVFELIKTVTDRVAQVGQQVTASSQAIASEAQATLRSIEEIATVASKTESQSSFTQEQAGLIDGMARALLEKVRFFRIPEEDKGTRGQGDKGDKGNNSIHHSPLPTP
jgi:methyl-accepting chemotaxis protein